MTWLLRLLAAAVVLTTACAPWLTVPPERLAANPDARERYEVWSGDTVVVLQAVSVTADSIQGVSAEDSLHSTGSHVSAPLADVDSLRVERQRANVIVWGVVHVTIVSLIFLFVKMLPST